MENLGIHVQEKATAVSTPAVATAGIPFVVGLAPVHSAAKPAKAIRPVLCTSWDEAVEKLGFSYDWKKFTLCEVMYSHFQLYGCQPVVFCNVLDPFAAKQEMEATDHEVSDHRIILPFAVIGDNSLVVRSGETTLGKDVDYSVLYDAEQDRCIVELLSSGNAYDATILNVSGNTVNPEAVTTPDIVSGVSLIDTCMNTVETIPDLICVPGYSHLPEVAAVMAAKAASINGLFRAKALIDADCGPNGVRKCADLGDYKTENHLADENQILCWPMVHKNGHQFHMSTHLAGLMAQVDTGNAGVPYESPSNKRFQIDGCCLEDGTEINLTFEESNFIASHGIVTALNFMTMGWTCRNNYTACYPENTDVKDYFIPVSRMFDWVANTIIRTFGRKLDKPMTRRLVDTILDAINIWLNGLVASEYLLGARAEFMEEENPEEDLRAGICRIHIYMTPPSPMQQMDFILEYDASYVAAAFQ